MSIQPLFYRNEKHAKTQPREIVLCYAITGAKAATPCTPGLDSLYSFQGAALTQAAINEYLSTPEVPSVNEFLAANFTSAAIGANGFAGFVQMLGQVQSIVAIETKAYIGTPVMAGAPRQVALDNTAKTVAAVSSAGNLAFKTVLAGLDAATEGLIVVSIKYISK